MANHANKGPRDKLAEYGPPDLALPEGRQRSAKFWPYDRGEAKARLAESVQQIKRAVPMLPRQRMEPGQQIRKRVEICVHGLTETGKSPTSLLSSKCS